MHVSLTYHLHLQRLRRIIFCSNQTVLQTGNNVPLVAVQYLLLHIENRIVMESPTEMPLSYCANMLLGMLPIEV